MRYVVVHCCCQVPLCSAGCDLYSMAAEVHRSTTLDCFHHLCRACRWLQRRCTCWYCSSWQQGPARWQRSPSKQKRCAWGCCPSGQMRAVRGATGPASGACVGCLTRRPNGKPACVRAAAGHIDWSCSVCEPASTCCGGPVASQDTEPRCFVRPTNCPAGGQHHCQPLVLAGGPNVQPEHHPERSEHHL